VSRILRKFHGSFGVPGASDASWGGVLDIFTQGDKVECCIEVRSQSNGMIAAELCRACVHACVRQVPLCVSTFQCEAGRQRIPSVYICEAFFSSKLLSLQTVRKRQGAPETSYA
jgi:hypothetical protein